MTRRARRPPARKGQNLSISLFTATLQQAIHLIRRHPVTLADTAHRFPARESGVFYQSTKFSCDLVGADGLFRKIAGLGGCQEDRKLPPRIAETGENFINWSDDQFLVGLCQLSSNTDQSVARDCGQLTHCGLKTMRRFIEDDKPGLLRYALEPLCSGF